MSEQRSRFQCRVCGCTEQPTVVNGDTALGGDGYIGSTDTGPTIHACQQCTTTFLDPDKFSAPPAVAVVDQSPSDETYGPINQRPNPLDELTKDQ